MDFILPILFTLFHQRIETKNERMRAGLRTDLAYMPLSDNPRAAMAVFGKDYVDAVCIRSQNESIAMKHMSESDQLLALKGSLNR